MNPLIQQIAIGLGGLIIGLLVGNSMALRRLRRTREAAQQLSDDMESRIAVKRLRIHELEGKLEVVSGSVASNGRSGPSPRQDRPDAPKRPGWLATSTERTPDSAPPRV